MAKSSGKKWLWILGGIALFLGALALAAPFLVPWDKVTAQLSQQGSKALGRPLSIGSVEVSFFTGVHVKDIKLANAGAGFSAQPLFSNADAKLNVSLLSILTGKLVINSISFDKPQLLLETNAEGRSNLAGLGGQAQAGAQAQPEAAKGGGGSLPLVVASLQIKDGELLIRDAREKSETGVKGLQFKLYGLSLAAAGGSRLEIAFDYEAAEGKKIPLSLVSNFNLDLGGHSVTIKSLEAKAPAVLLTAQGTVQHFDAQPAVDAQAQLDLDLAKLPALLTPSQLKRLPGELKSSGTIQLALQAKGSTAQMMAMDGNVKLSFDKVNLAYGSYPGLGDLQGTLSVTKAGADLPALNFKLGGDPATLALKANWGSLDNLLGGAAKLKADVQLSLKAAKLNLDPVLAMGGSPDTPEETAAKAEQAKDSSIPDMRNTVPAGLDLRADVKVDSLEAQGVQTGKLDFTAQLKARKLKTSTDLALYNGQAWERVDADFNVPGPTWGGEMGMTKLDFAPFIRDLAKALPKNKVVASLNGKLTGSLGLKAELKGKGFKPALRARNMSVQGNFVLKDGLMKKLDIQEALANAIPHPQTQEILRSDIQFSNATGDFNQAGDRFTLQRFTLGSGDDWRGGDVLIQASGTSSPGQFDFKVIPRFNPRRVKLEGTIGDAFNDEAGWASYNYVAYYGPSYSEAKADFKAGLQNAAKSAVKKQVDRKVDEVKQKASDLLKDKAGNALKGLFGR
jgi:uncharacterized protein involved in outer membrane biogenesis